eukprot:gnl/MRDRNA2_/MRDRNA2_26926_c0_seq1.p1 gnl/MRDRNA2_/MRDRNA2_26926_c0~~gnl/MRDRNA2_/MRDRNA2_26926_c0_seq1.p1  ORF type:complete len:123 (-),score=9.62 gnl/MRDRNA2_/MRDRNA2_26926_c0_seq1:7-375(-)
MGNRNGPLKQVNVIRGKTESEEERHHHVAPSKKVDHVRNALISLLRMEIKNRHSHELCTMSNTIFKQTFLIVEGSEKMHVILENHSLWKDNQLGRFLYKMSRCISRHVAIGNVFNVPKSKQC